MNNHLFKMYLFSFHMHVCLCLHVCPCTMCIPDVHGGQTRCQIPLAVDFSDDCELNVGPGNLTWVLWENKHSKLLSSLYSPKAALLKTYLGKKFQTLMWAFVNLLSYLYDHLEKHNNTHIGSWRDGLAS